MSATTSDATSSRTTHSYAGNGHYQCSKVAMSMLGHRGRMLTSAHTAFCVLVLPSRARCSHGRLRHRPTALSSVMRRSTHMRIGAFEGALRCVLVLLINRLRPAAPCRAQASSAHGERYACMHEGAGLSAVELRQGSMVIPNARCSSSGLRHQRLEAAAYPLCHRSEAACTRRRTSEHTTL